jgi:hypothetical protein
VATADDALNCCQATNSLLQQLLAALASFQDALNALQARVDELERELGEKHFDAYAVSDIAKADAPPNVTADYIQSLAPNIVLVTDPADAASGPPTPPGTPPPPSGGPPTPPSSPPESGPPASSGPLL